MHPIPRRVGAAPPSASTQFQLHSTWRGAKRVAAGVTGHDERERTTDEAILDELHEGRNNTKNLADALGYTRERVSARIRRLREHDHIDNIGGSVYEVVDDLRE